MYKNFLKQHVSIQIINCAVKSGRIKGLKPKRTFLRTHSVCVPSGVDGLAVVHADEEGVQVAAVGGAHDHGEAAPGAQQKLHGGVLAGQGHLADLEAKV